MSEEKKSYKETLNLPQTDFPIRAGLINLEPELLSGWESDNVYSQIKAQQQSYSKEYQLHDGPPYPNGNIHMGHALNKVLKDVVVRSKLMTGHKSHYVPGWDCHGLPIETQVIKELKAKGEEEKKKDIQWFRNRCKEFALDYVDNQKEEFKRLGIFGEWDNPYLTLHPEYEAKVVELFGKMAENGIVYQGRKPIHWCMNCETALAEAEIEHQDHRSPSIYFKFKIEKASEKLSQIIKDQAASIMIWTTTPWTLPANVAIAAHPDFKYTVFKANEQILVCVKELLDPISAALEFENVEVLGEIMGDEIKGTVTKHAFIDRESPVVNAAYVTKEDGTGFVHIAPGHGHDDYIVGLEYKLPMVMPVDNKGRFTEDAHMLNADGTQISLEGKAVFDANKDIGIHMNDNGSLLKLNFIKHSYPHCWRCKKPVIFRATEQWFIAMDTPMKNDNKTLREKSLEAIKKTRWYPDWGENRIHAMIENRPDWCVSRQRYWGIPIPVFKCTKCGNPEMTGIFSEAVVKAIEKEGSMIWFSKDASEILPSNAKCSKCGASEFEKEKDILDVWFESGSSFSSVCEVRPELHSPAELYLEGSDQHRGWFQSSMLIGIGARNEAPYKNVLTHGFIVDDKGRKMSKSDGNVIAPQKILKDYGADILRWWIAGSDFKNDISISTNVINQARDSFGKVRNTIRFCLSNLNDYNHESDAINYEDLNEIDKWALLRLNQMVQKVRHSYEEFEFHMAIHTIHDFCTTTLSALYLDMTKDRLYCDKKDGQIRRSTQTVVYEIADSLIKLIAPILVFSAEDAYKHFQKANKKASVHLEGFPEPNPKYQDDQLEEKWTKLIEIKNTVYQKLEQLRNEKIVKSFLEAKVDLTLPEQIDFDDWESIFIVSTVNIINGADLKAEATRAEGEKCERCWKVLPINNGLCKRCESVCA